MSNTQAWSIVKASGTPREIETGAHFLAYGRFTAVQALASTILARSPRHLTAVA